MGEEMTIMHHPLAQPPPLNAALGGGGVGGGRPPRPHERENLRYVIQQWNANRLDLFEISEPDENLEFHGVMRFYFQDSGQKVATKCIRVSSSFTTKQVIATLIEKFRPDMRMLSAPSYLLYEIHENGEERRLADDEKPLLVQLNWNKDDREGRFLLRRMDLGGKVQLPPLNNSSSSLPKESNGSNFIRKLSRREKKDLKKQEKQRRAAESQGENSVAEKLYTELPETSFTRSISNPEAVMRRRRAQKLEKKLQQFRSKDGGPDTGGTLKIYGSSLCPDVPYKTLLLSVNDTAQSVVKEMLEKYGLYRENPANYCLIQAVVTAEEAREGYEGPVYPSKEYILDDDECPLAILMNHSAATGSIMFHVRRRPVDHGPRKRKKKPVKGSSAAGGPGEGGSATDGHHQQSLPLLVELGPEGNELAERSGNHHQLLPNVTEVGSERGPNGQLLQLFGPDIHPRHCVIAHTDGVVTVTPCNREAETAVNGQRIFETTILKHGSVVRFGRQHCYRFVDPQLDPRMSSHITPTMHRQQHPQPLPSITMGQQHMWPDKGGSGQFDRYPPARDPILPAVLEFREETEDAFFHAITTALDPTHVQFKLAPTYTLYMAARFRASTHYRPELPPMERAQRLTIMLSKVAVLLQNVVQSRARDPMWLSFWLANCSELLHFLKQDRHISGYSIDAQDRLAELVQVAFRALGTCMQSELEAALPLLLEDRDDSEEEEGSAAHVLSILTNTMALLRRCRVNAALTIQLFSQLFHYLSMWVFNKLIHNVYPNYCTKVWGSRIRVRLARIETWAEKQGLELAADCHLAKLIQAAVLLTSPKSCPEDIASISSSCFKLNSIQLRALLDKYEPQPGEMPIPHDLRDSVVAVAESTADGLAREEGQEIRLEEDYDLQLPFILPEDGYSCDIVRGVPSGLAEFMAPLQHTGLCRMNPQPTSSGYWTIYMFGHDANRTMPPPGPRSPSVMSQRSLSLPRGEPEVQTLHLRKTSQGMGLSIVATRGLNQDQLGIYIKSVVPGGSADQDGRLQAGDQLLSVDGRSLVGISQERAAEYMKRTGSTVILEVAKQGAFYHGLATVLEQPSPQGFRPQQQQELPPNRYASEKDLSGGKMLMPPQQGGVVQHPYRPHMVGSGQSSQLKPRMQPAKSVPALNSEGQLSSELSKSTSFDHQQQQPYGHGPNQHQQQQPDIMTQSYSGGGPGQEYQNSAIRSRSTQNLSAEMPMNDDRHYQNINFHAPPPHRSPHHPTHPRPASALLQREDLARVERHDLYRPSSQRDVRHHDMRLVHLPEEGEMVGPQGSQQYPLPQQQQHPSDMMAHHQPPPTAPKPRGGNMQAAPAFRPMMEQYRESPPPPPPPASTHPLLQSTSSLSEAHQQVPPPPASSLTTTTRQPMFNKNSAWERDEKERYERRRREAARQWRDEQIAQLESIPNRTPQENQKLETLQLEREFEQRAKQADEEDENSDDDDEAEREDDASRTPLMEKDKTTVPRGGPGFMNGGSNVGPTNSAEEERAKRADEIRKKQQELQHASEVEKRLLREAQRRQEEEALQQQQQQTYHQTNSRHASQRLDSLVGSNSPPKQQPPVDYSNNNGAVNGLRNPETLNNNSNSNPRPPERHSSYGVVQQQQLYARSSHSSTEYLSSPNSSSSSSAKRVQFTTENHLQHNTSGHHLDLSTSFDANANQEDMRSPTKHHNPADFINEAEEMLNFSPSPIRTPGNTVIATPGVIGAQEVYRDPRVRRLQEKQAQQAASSNKPAVPETLTFREKMKMFAAETGDPNTPKDKAKSSRAQRDIE